MLDIIPTPEEKKIPVCPLCKHDLSSAEVELHHKTHIECRVCHYCHNPLQLDIINKQIKEHGDDPSDIIVHHQPCRDRWIEQEFAKSPVTITREHLDYLTRATSMFRPDMSVSWEANQSLAELAGQKFIHEMSIDEIFVSIKRMQAISAMWSIALDKKSYIIQKKLDDIERDRAQCHQAEDIRSGQINNKQEKKRETAVRMSPEGKKQEKAIEALVKFAGLTREEALLQLQARKEMVQ